MAQKDKKPGKKYFISTRGQKVMLLGIILAVVACVLIYVLLGVKINNDTNVAIDTIGDKTMSEASFQYTQRCEGIIDQQLKMVKTLRDEFDPDEEGAIDRLKKNALISGFDYLGFLDVIDDEETISKPEDGRTMNALLGDFIVSDLIPFRRSILKGEEKAAAGRQLLERATKDKPAVYGEDIVMFSVPTDKYTLESGQKSKALVAGLSNTDFIKMLRINSEDQANTSVYIIRLDVLENGETNSLVIKHEDDEDYSSLSALLKAKFANASFSVDSIIRGLNDNLHNNRPYSAVLHNNDEYLHMYCNKLNKSEWYLLSITNNSEFSNVITSLNSQWVIMIVVSIATIVAALVVIFFIYNHYNQKTLAQLDNARKEAISANKAKSEFLSNMSHDIRTPMNAIVGMTAIASCNIDNKAQVQDCLKKITLSSKHLLGLINDVLDMSKIESGKMTLNLERVSLREVFDGVATISQPQIKIKEQKFDMIIHDIITEDVYCDSIRLNQVLLNLLSNAVKFTPEHGEISVRLSQEPSPLGENYVRNHIDVIDNGMGMSPEFQEKLFESFIREDSARIRKTEGTGLGMAITKYIIDAMKGKIEVTSEPNKGTHFHIVLDLEKLSLPEEEDMTLPDWNMLVVDDDETLCRTTVSTLEEIGIKAEWTLSGEDAVKKTVQASKGRKPYDIILLDWQLPGMDGIETARQIRKDLGDEIPILLISAYDWSDMEKEAREAGINGFISKPLFKSTLFCGLRKFTDEYKETDGNAKIPDKNAELNGKHILVAEDNDLNWEIAEMLLTDVGVVVDRAENGKICVDMLQSSEAGTYDAILMDIRMPVMTGYEATEQIRALDHPDSKLPIIAMTADAFVDDIKKCLDCGMNAHISKPIDINMLKTTLLKFIS